MKRSFHILLMLFCVISCFAKKKESPGLTSDVSYTAKDSIVMIGSNIAELYGDAVVNYQDIELKAAYIRLELDSSIVYAVGTEDSVGNQVGNPVFKEGGQEYEAREMRYNFKSKKGLIKGTVTQQGEGYVTANKTKKVDEDLFCMSGGKYTTCDNHDHPHFYLALTKAKMKQGKYIVSGPAYMVVQDVPLPLAIPFGYFPINQTYSSGILFPTIGDESERGFYAKGFGYYFAINDYVDLALTADIYSKGSWSLTLASSYKWRYKFSGSFNMSFMQNVFGEKYTPDYRKSNDFRLLWTHTQDPKMSPNTQFSASVNFSTSSYEQNNIDSYYNPALISQNTKSSTVTLTQTIPDTPLTISASMSVAQRTSDSTLNLTLPQLTFSMTRIYPFKRKKAVGKEKWYEKIALSYNMNISNSVTCKEDKFLHTNFLKDWKNGIKHEIPISASFTIAKYLNLNINLNNTLKWYFMRIDQHWEGDLSGAAVADTSYGFYNIYNFSASVGLQTQLFGFFTPKVKKGKNAPVFRHKFVPSVSLSFAPDYGADVWKYWGSYQRPNNDGGTSTVYYDRYSHGTFGGSPSRGAQGLVSFNIANNLEMKYWSKNDTTGKPKKVTLIDNFSFGSSYNFIADSLNWSNININLRLKFFSQFSMNIDFVLDPYTYQLNEYGAVTKVNVSQIKKNHVLGRLMSTGTSFGYTFNNDTFKKKKDKDKNSDATGGEKKQTSELEDNIASVDPLLTPTERQLRREKWKKEDKDYKEFKIPWSLSLNYSIRYAYDKFNTEIMEYDRKLTHNLSISGSIDFTPTWHFSLSTYYDITNNKWTYMNCTISKDLHCWQMSCSFVPIGTYTTYNFMIGVKSTLLQDLKYTKEADPSNRIRWY
ncbi:MAG: LPS-assembly protein LptD [Paludibacteraceae bacterium]|nr:LPS-assembly protein LptD [Paludibacteraceae bacterium]